MKICVAQITDGVPATIGMSIANVKDKILMVVSVLLERIEAIGQIKVFSNENSSNFRKKFIPKTEKKMHSKNSIIVLKDIIEMWTDDAMQYNREH